MSSPPANDDTRIAFPEGEYKVQSPYLYLQSAGSTGDDGSAYGAHVRWLLLRNLGETHLPKGDLSETSVNFNRLGDYVTLLRSLYEKRFPTVLDFNAAPDAVNDAQAFWVYTNTNTATTIYVHFRDAARYAATRSVVSPTAQPLKFVEQYCPGLIEVEVKDKLFFAAEFDVERDASTVLRVEALSVETNVPLSPVFVSCRKVFTNENWCPPEDRPRAAEDRTHAAIVGVEDDLADAPECCDGPNLIPNGGFENALDAFWFQTDYKFQGGANFGSINVTPDASNVNGSWQGLPHSGRSFLAVDGSTRAGGVVLRFTLEVEPHADYCFAGWLATLWRGDVSIPLQFRLTQADGPLAGTVDLFERSTPATVLTWEHFDVTWNSGPSRAVMVEIISLSVRDIGNDFGLDDLTFCRAKSERRECRPRIVSENVRSVRFDVQGGHPLRLEFETYDDYTAGAGWEELDGAALTTDGETAFARLEPEPGSVHGCWKKFNDNALLNVLNYQDRWARPGGLGYGIGRYIALSESDPLAVDTLPGDDPTQDGSIQISLLDALRMVSLDFHVARMLGLGHLDLKFKSDNETFVYLAVYDTEGALDDTNAARPVRHYYMGVPTCPRDHRLPGVPQLKPVTYGLAVDNGAQQPDPLTDPQGYTPDGLARYVNIFVEPEADANSTGVFFVPPVEFCAIDMTSAVFYGVEYRAQGETAWRTPEVAHDLKYKDLDTATQFETLPLPNNAEPDRPVLRHEEREPGVHEYGGYGINWFSRASAVGNVVATDATVFKKANLLLPPSNFAAQLIQKESPLMLTTAAEQSMLAALTSADKTLVRVTFDYCHTHDLNYDFADSVELFFRSEMPRNVVGAVKSVSDDPNDNRNTVVRTTAYAVNSQGTSIVPTLDPTLYANFVGGVLTCGQESYVVVNVSSSSAADEGPVFIIRKNVSGNASDPGGGSYLTVQRYTAPQVDPNSTSQLMFMAVENMADPASWGSSNPLPKVVAIGDATWTTHQETYVRDGETRTITLRGVVASTSVTLETTATVAGVYRIEFQTYTLPHHPQSGDAEPVEWHKGVVRVPRAAGPNAPMKVLEVLLVEHVGDGQALVLHALDNAYDVQDQVATAAPVDVNYYPGYKVYLHAAATHNFDEAAIMPASGEGHRKTWLGARSRDTALQNYSPVGTPAPVVALEFVEPLAPARPVGAEFATRPDVYYKSSYTFTLDFQHKPFAVALYRANEEAILHALYKDETRAAVKQQLSLLGGDDPYIADRWRNILDFDYVYDVPGPAHPYFDPTGSNQNGTFRKFPAEDGYAFPNPDRGGPLDGSAPGDAIGALKGAVAGAFTALTEMPLVFDFIKGPSYSPTPKPQNMRDARGTLLDPADPAFDMSPMAKRTGNGFEIQFTDFTLDGAGNNLFFYLGREIGNRGRLGEPGPVAGPIRLVNTRPPDTPGVKKMYVQEANPLDGVGPAVHFEVNAYPAVQNVQRMLIYRATDAASALTARTMELVKTMDFAQTSQLGELAILLSDDFESGFVPYGDPLFYRIVALRQLSNRDGGTDWVPSQPSKLLLTTVLDSANPEAPDITSASDGPSGSPAALSGVVLSWPAAVYNGTYYLDKMNGTGNWVTIHQVKTNDDVTVDLAATDLGTNVLPKEDADESRPIYHRFRVRVENSSGLFNLRDRVLML
jgi:hypothetical protein